MKHYVDHKWKMVPHSKTERRDALLSLRHNRITCSVPMHDKRHLNIDTGKFDSDKLGTIYATSFADICVDGHGGQNADTVYKRRYRDESEKWFTPKDDDFDKECKSDEEIKYQKYITQREKYLKEEDLRQQRINSCSTYIITYSNRKRIF